MIDGAGGGGEPPTRPPRPPTFREALLAESALERDAWFDRLLAIDAVPDDAPDLPRGCVPYLPCPIDALLSSAEHARIGPEDVFVDVGSGIGRAAVFMHLLTGASVIGLEIQPALVGVARDLARRLGLDRVSFLEGDAAQLRALAPTGSVFFLYCPFSGERLERMLDDLEPIARARPIRVSAVDVPLPPRAWLEPVSPTGATAAVFRSRG